MPSASLRPATHVPATATPSPGLTPVALAYLDEALDYMQRHSLYRERIDWSTLRRETLTRAEGAQTPADTHLAIVYALRQLGDNHSFFFPPAVAARWQRREADAPQPAGRRLDGDIGYVQIPAFRFNGAQAVTDQFAANIVQTIRAVDQTPTCGWVVDLRDNRGGNMWPMLAGLGPLFGEGQLGAFAYPSGREEHWLYRDGQVLLGDQVRAQGPVYHLARPHPPVAVLTDRYTASSGEAVAIAFRGRPNTRSFGEPTAGTPTANDVKVMPDGAWLGVTEARMADRTGRAYDAPLAPDQPVEGFWTFASPEEDRTLQAALTWLRQQPECADARQTGE